ncbi:MAG: tetratricopeptide repeat protein [Bacteroidetes bacterium]|nr:tetratricopeptide repeat protein [Bacteroidota bacterium]
MVSQTLDLNHIPPIEIATEAIGRADDLRFLHKHVGKSDKVAVVRGIGGMGKTTFVKAFVATHRADFDHIAWIGSSENLVASVANDTQLHQSLGLHFTEELPEDRFLKVMSALNQCPGNNLLVLDNAETSLTDTLVQNKPLAQWLPGAHWKKIATSREHLTGFQEYPLERLEPDHALDLFRLHYPSDDSNRDVLALIELVDYHTLTLEILAKTLAKDRGRGNITLAKVHDSIANHRLHDDDLQKLIELEHPGDKSGVYKHLFGAFEVVKLDAAETAALQLFLLLPTDGLVENAGHPLSFFEGDFPLPEILKPDIVEVFDNLVDKGWLERDKENRYKLHRLLREVLLYKIKPSVEAAEGFIWYIANLFNFDVNTNFPKLFPLLPFGDAVIELYADSRNEAISLLQNNLGSVYEETSNYKKASQLLEAALASSLASFVESHPNVATSKSNLANVYRRMGRQTEAALLMEAALVSDLANFGALHPTLFLRRSNLANVYYSMGRLDKAAPLLEAALASDLARFGESHARVALIKSNLAVIYNDMGHHATAATLLETALVDDIARFGEMHPNIAVSRTNLALVYRNLGRHVEAIQLLEAAYASDLANFGESHPNIAVHYNKLALIFVSIGNYEKALRHFQKALSIFKIVYEENHPDINTVNKNIIITISQGAAAGDPAMLALQAQLDKEAKPTDG